MISAASENDAAELQSSGKSINQNNALRKDVPIYDGVQQVKKKKVLQGLDKWEGNNATRSDASRQVISTVSEKRTTELKYIGNATRATQ